MPGDEMRQRLRNLVLLTALLLALLAGRMLYLAANLPALAARAGIELEIFHQVPASPGSQPATGTAAPGRVRVPDLKGDTFAEAGARLGEAGLLMEGKGDLRGRVIRQEPAAGRLVQRGTPVRVWLKTSP